jgi:hypothetical protein
VILSRRTLCAALATTPLIGATAAHEYFAFSYFRNRDDGAGGMRLAISDDGRRFTPVRGGAAMLVPGVGKDRLMRDPCVVRDPRNGRFHMVWTTGWTGREIGHAASPDLVHWGRQQAIPVMAVYPGARNAWAPEAIFDARTGRFVIVWASTVDGAFPATDDPGGKPRNHRMYCTETADFRTFTPTRLFYDPGFNVIDATFLRDGTDLFMFVKDETAQPPRKYIQFCRAASPTGPFGPLSAPITPAWSEGPTAFMSGGEHIVFYDRYRENRFAAIASRDMTTWRDISAEIAVPDGASHGTIIPISPARYRALLAIG